MLNHKIGHLMNTFTAGRDVNVQIFLKWVTIVRLLHGLEDALVDAETQGAREGK